MLMDEHQEDEGGFKYNPNDKVEPDKSSEVIVGGQEPQSDSQPDLPPEEADQPLFNWSAPDSFSAHKNFSWYLVLLVLTLGVSAGVYFITKDKITTSVILVSGFLIGIYAAKKPKSVNYQLTKYGFTINGRYHEFGDYRSFSIVNHGDGRSAVLTPLKRFMPYMYIYFERDIEQQILTALTDVLPKETSHKDAIDNILRKIGF